MKAFSWTLIVVNYLLAAAGLTVLVSSLVLDSRSLLEDLSLPLVVAMAVALIVTQVSLIATGNPEFLRRGQGMLTLLRPGFVTAPYLGWVSVALAIAGLIVAGFLLPADPQQPVGQGIAAAVLAIIVGSFFALAAFGAVHRRASRNLEGPATAATAAPPP